MRGQNRVAGSFRFGVIRLEPQGCGELRLGFVQFSGGGEGFAVITLDYRIGRDEFGGHAKMFAGFGGAALTQQRHAKIPLAVGESWRDAVSYTHLTLPT